jgi:hypothetical protein
MVIYHAIERPQAMAAIQDEAMIPRLCETEHQPLVGETYTLQNGDSLSFLSNALLKDQS